MDERPADRAGDGLRPNRRVGGVTAESMDRERDASTACEGHVADGASVSMEEVLRRENLKAAYVRVVRNGGAVRVLGIPTVMDRMIQQALNQKLTRVFDVTFSDDSYGFRPGRSAHQAVLRSKEHIEAVS